VPLTSQMTRWELHRHERTCNGDVIYKYPGGVYHTPQTVFDWLEDEGIDVPEEDRYYPYRATYDIEVMLQPTDKFLDSIKFILTFNLFIQLIMLWGISQQLLTPFNLLYIVVRWPQAIFSSWRQSEQWGKSMVLMIK
jgi:hypothetical protein